MPADLGRRAVLIGAASAAALPAGGQSPPPDVVRALAPTGRLRAAINHGNPVLAHRDEGTGELTGISVDLARELARRLAVPVDLLPFEAAGKVSAAAGTGVYDICFLAVDPKRAEGLAFSAPYVIIEGTYLVPDGSALLAIPDVDRDGVRIAVGRGSAYDLFLTRAIRHATLVRSTTSGEAVEMFRRDGLEAAGGVRQPLVRFAAENPGFRVLPGRFMAIEQAMATPLGREGGVSFLRAFVEEMKRSGFVANAIARNAQPDAAVAPAAG